MNYFSNYIKIVFAMFLLSILSGCFLFQTESKINWSRNNSLIDFLDFKLIMPDTITIYLNQKKTIDFKIELTNLTPDSVKVIEPRLNDSFIGEVYDKNFNVLQSRKILKRLPEQIGMLVIKPRETLKTNWLLNSLDVDYYTFNSTGTFYLQYSYYPSNQNCPKVSKIFTVIVK